MVLGQQSTHSLSLFVCLHITAAGGLGHVAVQYGAAMGMRVLAIDMPDKLDFCMSLGAEQAYNATDPDTAKKIQEYTKGGSHGVLCVGKFARD